MAETRPLVCPVLVGRDDLLALADRRRAEARSGRGGMLLLAGEAGVGKSRLTATVERRGTAEGFAVVRGAAYPGDIEVAGGTLLDLARSFRRSPVLGATGAALAALLEVPEVDRTAVEGDLHRRRRILLLDTVDLVAAAPGHAGRPVLMVVEDLHWADEITLDALAMLSRRLAELPILVIGTYRSDELYPSMPVRAWRTRLLTSRLAEEARVARLDRAAVATMVSVLRATGLPAPGDLVDLVHARSDGVPLHVEELVALVGHEVDGASAPAETRLGDAVPESLGDAILRRADRLTPRARRAADAASVIGRSFEVGLLAAVLGRTPDALGRDLAELERAYVIQAAPDGTRLDFRHALIRDALYDGVLPAARRRLHARVADATASDPRFGPAFRSVHLEQAGRREAAFSAAMEGARVAAGLSAHREARDLLERARRTTPPSLPVLRRAEVLAALADEAAATDDNEAADAGYADAAALFREAGDHLRAADLAPRHVAVRHLLGDGLGPRTARLEGALAEVEASGAAAGATLGVRARVLAGLAAANMLDRRLEPAIAYGSSGRVLAARAGDLPTELDIAATVGSCLVFAGRMDEGWGMLEDAVARSRDGRLEAQAARSYRMLASCASVLVEYDRAEPVLMEGAAYAERVELWNHRHYLAAHLAHVRWATGAWTEAESLAAHALADGRGGITTRITALHVLGYVALGRGDDPRAVAMLREALGLAEGMGELQRVSPAVWGLAEAALLRGDGAEAADWCERGAAASAAVDDTAHLFPYLVTGTRARLALHDSAAAEAWVTSVGSAIERRAIPGSLPAVDHARGLVALARGATGRAREHLERAERGWAERRRAWEGTWATLDLATLHARANRPTDATRLAERALGVASAMGALPVQDEAGALLRRLRARAPATSAFAPLTAREVEVAQRITLGHTNGEIAEDLGVSVRTVTAHVEHILARLGATRRAEIAAWAARVGAAPGEASAPGRVGGGRRP